jgi:hypothetical protein
MANGPKPFLPFSQATIRAVARENLQYHWTEKWQTLRPCRQTRILFPAPNQALSKGVCKLNQKDLGALIRNSTGFSYLHYHQSNIQPGIIDPTFCLCGAAKEESQHLIKTALGLQTYVSPTYGSLS